jgi:hypothetical protein
MQPATDRFKGSVGASFFSPGLRLEMATGLSLHGVEIKRAVEDVGPFVRTGFGKLTRVKMRFVSGPVPRVFVGFSKHLR